VTPEPRRAGSYDPVERARLRAQVFNAAECPFGQDGTCSTEGPVWHMVEPDNAVRCHLYQPKSAVARRLLDMPPGQSSPTHTNNKKENT